MRHPSSQSRHHHLVAQQQGKVAAHERWSRPPARRSRLIPRPVRFASFPGPPDPLSSTDLSDKFSMKAFTLIFERKGPTHDIIFLHFDNEEENKVFYDELEQGKMEMAIEEAQHLKKLIQDFIASFIKVGDKVGASKFLKLKYNYFQ
ncbi:hypothetical protein H5410_030497 [Solanum commersonii]|uniref:Uncharacterized protein n=1 Tax=Solanum commersonii TaxID=4109 RepID=A0A9J5YH23_SOLCO|nr:hypothetical protein H5410_030497 [Solanum commersonii]